MGAQAVRLSNVDIDNALKNKDFEVLFQPIFDLGNGALARMETFVRWRHASLGLLPPGAFISFFETQGRMSELTRYVLNEALREYRDWRGASAPGFSINLALSDLADDAFAAHFDVALRDCGFPPELITLECPMPPVDLAIETAAAHVARLADTGARLAIEVRGRANDFLRQTDPFPFDEIKTGGAAILRFARTVRGPGLSAISELLDIANKANAAITAVGVEDQASLAALRGLGFAAAQGNHLGKVGDLKSFTPSRVNEVRSLLGLEPLASADLHALFRTQAPALQGAERAPAPAAVAVTEAGDALVERLAARIARQSDTGDQLDSAEATPEKTPGLQLAPGRAAARALAKAAAIARAKRRAASLSPVGAAPAGPLTQTEEPSARQWQQRLNREFGGPEEPLAAGAADRAPDEFDLSDEVGALDPPLDSPADSSLDGQSIEAAQTAPAHDLGMEMAPTESKREVPEATVETVADRRSAEADEAPVRVSLAVGAARAYFRPGMRIGVLAPTMTATLPDRTGEPPVLREGPGAAPQEAAAPAEPDLPPTETQSPARPTLSAAKGEARASALAEASFNSEPTPAEPLAAGLGAAQSLASEAIAATPPRARRSFFKRVVVPFPTHFWPIGWKRALQRRRAARAARRSGAGSATAE